MSSINLLTVEANLSVTRGLNEGALGTSAELEERIPEGEIDKSIDVIATGVEEAATSDITGVEVTKTTLVTPGGGAVVGLGTVWRRK